MSENHRRKNGIEDETEGKRKETMKIYSDDVGGGNDDDDEKSGNGKSTLNYIKK